MDTVVPIMSDLGRHSVYMDTMTIPIVRCPEIVSVTGSGVSGYGSLDDNIAGASGSDSGADSNEPSNMFKSEFAKQLEDAIGTVPVPQANYLGDLSLHQLTVARYDKHNDDLRKAKVG